jgi:hypothetical protein
MHEPRCGDGSRLCLVAREARTIEDPTPEQYLSIATRYEAVAGASHTAAHEGSAFATTHALESAACAWIRHKGQQVTRGQPHRVRLERFQFLTRGQPIGNLASSVTTTVNAMRNHLLYPRPLAGGGFDIPRTALSSSDALHLAGRVRRVVAWVAANT